MRDLNIPLDGDLNLTVEKLDSDSTVIVLYPDVGEYAVGALPLSGAEATKLYQWLGKALGEVK